MNQCKVTVTWFDTGHETRCVRPEGHTGWHRDPVRWFDGYGFQQPQEAPQVWTSKAEATP